MASIRVFFTNTSTYTYPLKRLDIRALAERIKKGFDEAGLRIGMTMAKAAGPWQGVAGENEVITIQQQGLFFMHVTVCYTKKHAQAEICYYPVVRKKGFQDSVHAMRCSQWDMMINSAFEIVRESISEMFGEAESVSEEEEAPDDK